MPRYVPAGGCIAWCIIPVYFIKIFAFPCKLKTGAYLFHRGGYSSVLLHKSINTVEETIYRENVLLSHKHYIKQSTSPPSKFCAHWRSRQLRRLPHQEQAVFHKLKNCFPWMPCLWVGEPVCHACAVGNHDFQGVPVIMVSLFYPYPYTESVCVLRSLIPEKLHQCCTWLLLLQSEPYSLLRVMVRYLYHRTQKQRVPQNRSTWRPGRLFNFRGPSRGF